MEKELITENFNTLLVLPSAIPFVSILTVISFKRWRGTLWENTLISGLVLTLLLMNFFEILTFGNFYKNYEILLRAYYCSAAVSSSFLLCLSERLNIRALVSRGAFYILIISLNILIFFFVFFSDYIVSGVIRTNYTISRIPGEYYWLYQVFILICIITGPILILRSIKIATNPLDKKRNIVILYSFAPIIFTVLLIMVLMQIGLNINFSIFLPFSALLFVTVYIFTETKADLFRFLINIPFSPERAAYKELNGRVIEYMSKTQIGEQISLKEAMSEIEKTFINRALKIKDGNHNLAAELLSISMSTIYRNKEREEDG